MEHEPQPDKRLVALVIFAVAVVPGLVAAELAFPSLQPRLVPATPSGSGPNPGGGGSSAASVKVIIANGVSLNHALNFAPSNLVLIIGVNNTVTWVNQDSTDHTATFSSAPSGVMLPSVSVNDIAPGTSSPAVTFTVAGTYQYHCQFHPGWMRGTIIVRA